MREVDVERLARAYHKTSCPLRGLNFESCKYRRPHERTAAALTTEYARLEREAVERFRAALG